MKSEETKETQNKSIGVGVSVGFHALVLLLFFVLTAWTDNPGEGTGNGGVVLNFGTVDAGMGDLANQTDVISNNYDDASPDKPASSDANEVAPSVETPETSVKEAKLVTTTATNSPYTVKDNAEKATPNTKEQKATQAASPKNDNKDSNTNGANGKNGSKNVMGASSNGDQNVLGDQGDPNGSLNSKNLYGKPGSGGDGTPSLNMAGWNWDDVPNKVDPSNEKGFIEFDFKVDDNGIVEWIKTKRKTVSPSVEAFYKKQLEEITFTKTGSNIKNNIGFVRFEVRTR